MLYNNGIPQIAFYIITFYGKCMRLLDELRDALRFRVITALSAISGMIALGTGAYHYLENWTWPQCFYFSVVTLTTVGYGDIHPTTDASRMFTAAYVLVGVGVMLVSLTTIATSYLKIMERETLLDHEKQLRRRWLGRSPRDEPADDEEDGA